MGRPDVREPPDEPQVDDVDDAPVQAPPARPPGRLRAAWGVLMGDMTTPAQVEAEWLEYKLIFGDILKRLGAQLARSAKAEHKRLTKALDAPEPSAPPAPAPTGRRDKSELRRRAAALRGLSSPSQPFHSSNGDDHP